MTLNLLNPIPPGEILLEEFMKPMGISINALSRDVSVPPNRISEIVNGKRSITANTALRLGNILEYSCDHGGKICIDEISLAWRANRKRIKAPAMS